MKQEKTIGSISKLFSITGAESPSDYARSMYNSTECGVSTTFILADRKIHSGDLTDHENTRAFAARYFVGVQHHAIVEGSEAEFSAQPLMFPATEDEWKAGIDYLEDMADEAWHEANDSEDDA